MRRGGLGNSSHEKRLDGCCNRRWFSLHEPAPNYHWRSTHEPVFAALMKRLWTLENHPNSINEEAYQGTRSSPILWEETSLMPSTIIEERPYLPAWGSYSIRCHPTNIGSPQISMRSFSSNAGTDHFIHRPRTCVNSEDQCSLAIEKPFPRWRRIFRRGHPCTRRVSHNESVVRMLPSWRLKCFGTRNIMNP